MPARVSKITASAPSVNAPAEPKNSAWFARITKLEPHIKRLAIWSGAALVGTCALGSAANYFLSVDKSSDRGAKAFGASDTSPAGGGNYGAWWNPTAEDGTHPSTAYGRTSDDNQSASSAGSVSVIPSNTGMPTFSGTLSVGNLAPIGANNTRQAYDILGLRTGNTPSLATTSETNITAKSSMTLVSFSLSGNIAQVPVNNLEAGGLTMVTATVPEPTTMAMLAAGLAGMAIQRRRKTPSLA